MRLPSRVLGVFLAFFTLFSGLSAAETAKRTEAGRVKRKVTFKTNDNRLTASVPNLFDLDMRTLLSDQGSGNLRWTASSSKPAWITIDSDAHRMYGTPAAGDVGTTRFRLTVEDKDAPGDGGATAQVTMTVNIAPVWSENPVNLGQAFEDSPFSFDLNTKVSIPSGSVTFSVAPGTSLPDWMSLSPSGILSGTPKRKDMGPFSGLRFVATHSSGGSSEVGGFGVVIKTIRPPKWVANPITLTNAQEDFPYSVDLNTYVLNFEGTPLEYTLKKSTLSGWLTVSPTGVLSGTPGKVDVGLNEIEVEVSSVIDGGTYADKSTLKVSVIHTNHTPKWSQDPIILGETISGNSFSAGLAQYASDVDGDALTFAIVSGPSWATMSAGGTLTGTPQKAHVGENTWVVSVSDGEFAPQTRVKLTVIKANEPPVWVSKPTKLPNAKEDFSYSIDLNPYAADPDKDKLSFVKVSGPGWASIRNGKIEGTPGAGDLGLNVFKAQVSDNISGEDTVEIHIEVEHTNHAPVWTQNPLRFTTDEKIAVSYNLSLYATDSDKSDKLTFSKVSGPAWASVSAAGAMTGTPQRENVGENHFVVKADDGNGAHALVDVIVTVLYVNQAPYWAMNPVTLPNARERELYENSLNAFAKDNDAQDSLSFSKVSGPAWLTVHADGKVSGTAQRPDVGVNSFRVKVTDPKGLSSETEVRITVEKVNRPPRWTVNPLALTDAFEDAPYQFSLASYAVDDDGDPLVFSKVSGPAWISSAASGQLSGTPKKADIGNFTAVFRVSDPESHTDVAANGTVIHVNHKPEISPKLVVIEVKERETRVDDLSKYASDYDGDTLSYAISPSATWAAMDPQGRLSLTPQFAQIGTHDFSFTVSDGQASDTGTVRVTVTRDPRPPVWTQNPIRFEAKIKKVFSENLAPYAKDLDGLSLSFSKKSGPAWLSVASDGVLSGTPMASDIADPAVFVVSVKNDKLSAEADLHIRVYDPNHAPSWTADPIVLPNAKEKELYTANLSSYATDPDAGDTLTFSKSAGPAWATISATGEIVGTPKRSDVGLNTFLARVTDSDGKSAVTTVQITVEYVNQRPYWTLDPLALSDAYEDKTYAFALSAFAKDDDGDALTFTRVSGPGWLFVGTNGALSGVPGKADVGDFTASFKVSDGKLDAVVQARGTVIHTNHTPVIDPSLLSFRVKERETVTHDLSKAATDSDGNALTYKLIPTLAWVALAADGKMALQPLHAHIGKHELTLEVSDGEFKPTAKVTIEVLRDPQTPLWLEDPIKMEAAFGRPFTGSVAAKASDPDGVQLTFSKVSGPAWLNVKSDGTLSGTPAASDEGENSFVLSVKNDGQEAQATLLIRVYDPNHAPYWTNNPIALPNAKEREAYSQNLAPFAKDDDAGDKLTFSKVSGPAWANVSGAGVFSGTPGRADVGQNSFVVRVTDLAGKSADVSVTVTVEYVNQAPYWTQNPLSLPNAFEDKAFLFDVGPLAKDDDGDALTFSKKSGPAWLTLSAKGETSGTPQKPDVGAYTAVFVVSDGKLSSEVTARGMVIHTNHPPVIDTASLIFEVKERETKVVDLSGSVSDGDEDKLTYTLLSSSAFATLSNDGKLTLKPLHAHIGTHVLKFKVSDGEFSPEAEIQVKVLRDPQAPVWLENPIRFEAKINQLFSASVAAKAKELDSITLTFSKKSGPGWLSVGSDGALSGTPGENELGENTFVLTAKNDALGSDTTVIVKVLDPNHAPYWTQNPVVLPKAKEKEAYKANLASFAKDDDAGDTLVFSKLSGPAWASINGAGEVSGTPSRKDVGLNEFNVRVTDAGGKFADATVQITVEYVNQAPYWTQNPLQLPGAFEDKAFAYAIDGFAKDDDNDTLIFTKKSGPGWLLVASNGELSGLPTKPDVGTYTVIFEVSDGRLSAEVIAQGVVIHTNHKPVIQENLWVYSVKEREARTEDLAKAVTDVDGDNLTYTLTESLDWVTLSNDGKLGLKPLHVHLGSHTFGVEVSDGLEKVRGSVKVTVTRDPQTPVWSENPIRFEAAVDKLFSESIKDKASDPDNVALTFSKVSGPAWLTVAADGKISGTPGTASLGENNFKIKVANDGKSAEALLIVRVFDPNQAPLWTQNPLDLGNAYEDKAYAFDLSPFAKDPEGDKLTFALLSGPKWLSVSGDGKLSGIPKKADIGAFSASFRVSDGKLFAEVLGNGTVIHTNHPPVITQPIVFRVKERELKKVSLTHFVSDSDGDKLSYQLSASSDWVTLDADGNITLMPRHAHLGKHEFSFSVLDAEVAVNGKFDVEVARDPQAPVWLEDPINLQAKVNAAFSATVADKVKDPDGVALSFTKSSGPAWLTVAADGALSGTPKNADLGENVFILTTKNDGLSSQATLIIRVYDPNHAPYWVQNPVVLPNGKEKQGYSADLLPFVKEEDAGDTLVFRKVSGPAWASIDNNGKVTGIPERRDVGLNQFLVRVTDSGGKFAEAFVHITIEYVNQAPEWTQKPLSLKDAYEDAAYAFDVSVFAKDADGDKLQFKKQSGPAWLLLSADGKLSGTPKKADVGNYTAVFEVSDGLATALVDAQGQVIHLNHPPTVPSAGISVTMKERETRTEDLTKSVTDSDGDNLQFSLLSTADWVSLDLSGALTLKPLHAHLGKHELKFNVTDGDKTVEGSVHVTVLRDPQPPVWLEDPIRFIAQTGKPFSESVAAKAKDLDGVALKFSKSSGPAWLSVSSNGNLTGIPQKVNTGENTFTVVAQNDGLAAAATVIVEVIHVNTPPKWHQNPISLGRIPTEKAFSFSLSSVASDAEGDPLTFALMTGPAWLGLSNDKLTGTPKVSDVGAVQGKVSVSDGTVTVEADYVGEVYEPENHPPKIHQSPMFTVKERGTLEVDLNEPKYVTDPENDPLTFSLAPMPSWVTFTANGKLTAKPLHAHLGDHSFALTVSDPKGKTATGALYIRVIPDPQAPIWLENPIRFEAAVNKPFAQSLSGKVHDPQGLSIQFTKKSGPPWLSIDANGALSGTPLEANLGENRFVVVAANGVASAEAVLIVTVRPMDDVVDSIQIDTAVAGASVENTWVVDNSWSLFGYDKVAKALMDQIHQFYGALSKAQVRSISVLLSSDAAKGKGLPVKGSNGSSILDNNDANIISDFRSRVTKIAVGKCYNSPIWSMFKFYEKLPELSDIYEKSFMLSQVPSDVLILTQQSDQYARYAQGTAQSRWKPEDYVSHFKAFHTDQKKSYRISAVAPECPSLKDPWSGQEGREESDSRAPNAYRTLVNHTGGQYYPVGCQIDMAKALKDYASRVIFSAYVHAKKRLKLTKVPSDPKAIELKLAGKVLSGNTGASDDKWYYDASTNEVVMQWHLIDSTLLKPGDRIEIRYRGFKREGALLG